MKKPMKKLELSRETLRDLEEADLAPMAGGSTSCPSIDFICKHAPTTTG
jgi:hypothetical protein